MRLDRDGMDRSPIDRSGKTIIYLYGTGNVQVYGTGDMFVGAIYLSGTGSVQVSGLGYLIGAVNLSGEGNVTVDSTGKLSIDAILSGVGEQYEDGTGSLTQYVYLSGEGNIQADASGVLFVYGTLTFTFAGSLAVGKTICIDGRDFTVINDGVNNIASFTGEFPIIAPNTSTVTYTDVLGARTLALTVTKKDRSV
jgi:hypothetical protein